MTKLVVVGATLRCSLGTTPAVLAVTPTHGADADAAAAASVDDHTPNVHIGTFGMCSAPANPQVAAATSAAAGVLTPQPCVPATSGPWVPGSTVVTVGTRPALTDASTCQCTWAGTITVEDSGSSIDVAD